MSLPPIPSEAEISSKYKHDKALFKRREVLRDTDKRLNTAQKRQSYLTQANKNLADWNTHNQSKSTASKSKNPNNNSILVLEGDWGVKTLELTKEFGQTFAVLNMANAYSPGGGCDEGMIAQEENMYRRTDCRQHVRKDELSKSNPRYYNKKTTSLINGENGSVAFDLTPRVCIKGPEVGNKGDGYDLLPYNEVFSFYELRSAAQDLRSGEEFDSEGARRRIAAQLDTLIKFNQKHVVLSAFGCGAFQNPPHIIAQIYKEELEKRADKFEVVAFAIFYPGFGPKENFDVFHSILHNIKLNTTDNNTSINNNYKLHKIGNIIIYTGIAIISSCAIAFMLIPGLNIHILSIILATGLLTTLTGTIISYLYYSNNKTTTTTNTPTDTNTNTDTSKDSKLKI